MRYLIIVSMLFLSYCGPRIVEVVKPLPITKVKNNEVRASLASIQHDEGKIFGSNSHITEGIIRAVWLASKNKDLNIFARRI